jgi:predicted NBD/HSP70 family sugar kinase
VLERMLLACGLPAEPIWDPGGQWPLDPGVLAEWIDRAARGLARAVGAAASVIDFERALIDGWMPAPVRARLVAATRARLAELDLTGLTPPSLHEGTLGPEARSLGAASRPLAERFLVDPAAMSTGM